MLIFQFALIFEKGLGRGETWHRRTHPRGKSVGAIHELPLLHGENVSQGHGCPLPCPS